ncbi:hypothetical protein MG293_018410 [Ovis ammon polii]|uniref:Uncharacterized protein n=1 Tax=Ovis ammon polii TaxID=230172 RepID=A0AAD4Y3C7_OVIAM|nr:hypothetical protein MG293_018410 [Ovis ammon polii]
MSRVQPAACGECVCSLGWDWWGPGARAPGAEAPGPDAFWLPRPPGLPARGRALRPGRLPVSPAAPAESAAPISALLGGGPSPPPGADLLRMLEGRRFHGRGRITGPFDGELGLGVRKLGLQTPTPSPSG